jgi:hypothetical protein
LEVGGLVLLHTAQLSIDNIMSTITLKVNYRVRQSENVLTDASVVEMEKDTRGVCVCNQ